jgi:predicted transcriptional regulator
MGGREAAMDRVKTIQLTLPDEEHTRLKGLAERRDTTISELIHQAIRQVYMSDLERDLTRLEVQRMGETPLLAEEEEQEIGIRGLGLLPHDGERTAD